MAYEKPTLDEFRTRFPIFNDSASDELVEMLIEEAAGQVNTAWIESDYKPAILYLTAHLIATDNSAEGSDPGSGVGGDSGGEIASESWGPISVSYRARSIPKMGDNAFDQFYGTTSYGRRYMILVRRSFPAILVV